MKFNSKTCHMKFLSSFQNRKVSPTGFVYNKVQHIKFILKVFALQKVYTQSYIKHKLFIP
jgi:hypothetical protein